MNGTQHSADSFGSRRSGRAVLGILASIVIAGLLVSCGDSTSTVRGRMFVTPGLQGSAPWGEVWLLRNYDRVRSDLSEHERLLTLALLQHDAEFMRAELDNILRIGEIRAQLNALRREEIPVRTTRPTNPTITPLTPIDSLFSLVQVQTRAATAAEKATLGTRIKALQDSAIVVRGRMQASVNDLSQKYATKKASLLKDADEIATRHRLMSTTVRMDGEYRFEKVKRGNYGLYGRYSLMRWFVLEPVNVNTASVTRDIGRLRSAIVDSRAVTVLDATVNQIESR